jgi:pimeloyl-ACP methyl ester carboxylesterase
MHGVRELVSRRRFLIGAGATGTVAVAGGAVAAAHTHELRRFPHSRGVLGGPDQAVPSADGPVEFGEFESSAARRRVGFGVYRPSQPAQAALFCLHGRGGSHRDPFVDLGVHRFVVSAGLPWLVAAVDGGEGFWHRRSDGSDTQRLVVDELMPMLLVGPAAAAKPVVMGWSMGGYGALLMAEQHPDVFVAAVASSPSIWRSFPQAAAGAFDSNEDFAHNDVLNGAGALRGSQTRADCGEDDVFADTTRDLLGRVQGTSGGIRAGYHESRSWRSWLPDQLEFVRARVSSS